MPLKQWGPDIWTLDKPLVLLGVNIGTRMTVIRLPDCKLMLISAVKVSEEERREIESLGTVSWLVAPNSFHHLFVKHWAGWYPEARLCGVSHLIKKRPDLGLHHVMDRAFKAPWGDDPVPVYIPGNSLYEEVVLVHRKSGTLVVTDLVFNVQEADSLWARMFLSIYGAWRKFGPTTVMRLFLRNSRDFRAAFDQVMQHDFNRIIVTHGQVVENITRDEFRAAFSRVLA